MHCEELRKIKRQMFTINIISKFTKVTHRDATHVQVSHLRFHFSWDASLEGAYVVSRQ